jgi:hypothetical protein
VKQVWWCGKGVVKVWCGKDAAKMWRRCGEDVAKMVQRYCKDVVKMCTCGECGNVVNVVANMV